MITEICFDDILLDSVKEVFETMIFMTVDLCPDCVGVEGESLLGSITFTGNIEGRMGIGCTTECAETIARNMLAMEDDEEINEAEIRDAMGEITNMVMGSIKANLLKQDVGNLNVSIPSVVSGWQLSTSLGDKAKEVSMLIFIDESIAELTLQYRINN